VGRFDSGNAVSHGGIKKPVEGHEHHRERESARGVFDTWSYETDQPFSLDALRQMVQSELPASIYRCKGIFFTDDFPDKRLTLQTVGRRTEIYELDEWGDRAPRTQIVAIGGSGQVDPRALTELFDGCICQPSIDPSSG
jgi:G3E family GTPase